PLRAGRTLQLLRRRVRLSPEGGGANDRADSRGLGETVGLRSARDEEQQLLLGGPLRGAQSYGSRRRRQSEASAPARGGFLGVHAAHDDARLRAVPDCRSRRRGPPEGDVRRDVPPAGPRGRGVQRLCREEAERASLSRARLGPRLGSPGDGRREVDLALGGQRLGVPVLRRRLSAGGGGGGAVSPMFWGGR